MDYRHRGLTLDVLVEYLALWDLLLEVTLHSEVEDMHVWQFSTTGQYTTKSAYKAFFIGASGFGPWESMEELGARQVQVLFVDCCTKSVLDS
jgi:hypothetical protein